jgi:phosphopantetheine--protein transferase-like protein
MAWMEVAGPDEAAEYVRALGDKFVDVRPAASGSTQVRLRKGAVISVPKALRFDRWVAGQIPTGWDPARLGIPADICASVDPVSLYSLCAVAEALLSAGVPDAYEFYEYVHVSEVGNSSGGGMGGMAALRKIFRERFLEGDMASDVLQESFINTVPAWVNMLLLSSSGPIRTPVGACATAAESVDVAVDALLLGRARVMIVGGFDDFGEEGSYEFAKMGATSSSAAEAAMGRAPAEAVRPMAPSRGGFMEAQGAGMQVLTTARLALDMGLPVYGVVAASNTATDKVGRSVPAPGQGVLTTAREAAGAAAGGAPVLPSPLLDVSLRRRRLDAELRALAAWRVEEEADAAREALDAEAPADAAEREAVLAARLACAAREVAVGEAVARRRWASADFARRDPAIAPLRAALAVFGLSIDDITVASFHGTGTAANDVNESAVTHAQMEHLGRTRGAPVFCVAQKSLTGHPKGAAAAWMVNGALQMLGAGVVPGAATTDDVDAALRGFHHVAHVGARPLALGAGGVRAVLVKSFGFGQAGGEVLLVHPDYLLASLPSDVFAAYAARRDSRERRSTAAAADIMRGRRALVAVKDAPPYTKAQEQAVYLNPLARARFDAAQRTWRFTDGADAAGPRAQGISSLAAVAPDWSAAPIPATPLPRVCDDAGEQAAALRAGLVASADLARVSGGAGIGVDIEPIRTFAPEPAHDFAERNFTPAERDYCVQAADPPSSWAGRWVAKEATVKALCSAAQARGGDALVAAAAALKGGGAPLRDVEISPTTLPGSGLAGAPEVRLGGPAAALARALGVAVTGGVRLSISHAGDYAVAVAALL